MNRIAPRDAVHAETHPAAAPMLGRRAFCAALGAVAAGAVLAPRLAAAAADDRPQYPDMVGEVRAHVTRIDETLLDIARIYNLGYTELIAANPGIDPWIPGAGVILILPMAHILPTAPRQGIVLNLADQRLYLFRPETATVETVPIGIGREAWNTPIGRTTIVRKRERPIWYVPPSIRAEDPELPAAILPGPDNPLGEYAIDLAWPDYLIHGTNKPDGVGRRVSHGCVRLYPEDIERLYGEIALGMAVTVVDQPVKLAWMGDELLIEVHPDQAQADEIEAGGGFTRRKPAEYEYLILNAAGKDAARLDWPLIRRAARLRTGIPVPILKPRFAEPPTAKPVNFELERAVASES